MSISNKALCLQKEKGGVGTLVIACEDLKIKSFSRGCYA